MKATHNQPMVYLVGAGPGDPDLLTVKALRLLQNADVVVYDRLISDDILDLIPAGIQRIYVGKACGQHHYTQDEINTLLLNLARGSKRIIVRLKGGDPCIFGRGGEEARYLTQHGIPVAVIPGITAASSAAYAGIPLTYRGLTSGVTLVTGHMRDDQPLSLNWNALAHCGTTLVLYMALHHLPEIKKHLLTAGMPGSTPVALIENASMPNQRHHITSLSNMATEARDRGFKAPTLVVIGKVVELNAILDAWNEQNLDDIKPAAHV